MTFFSLFASNPFKQGILILVLPVFLAASEVIAQQEMPEINITGAGEALERNIRTHVRIGLESCNTSLIRLDRLKPQVLGNVQIAGQALGYYRLESSATFSMQESCWRLDLEITPGEQIIVSEVSIRLPESAEVSRVFQETLENLPVLTGQALNHSEYESVKNELSAIAVENGYFSARFNRSQILLDLSAYQASIVIDFDPGTRFRFGAINVEPVPGFSEQFLNSMIQLEPGSPYSSAALLAQRQQLDNLQYFRQITISPQLSLANNQSVPVNIVLTPRPRNAWSTGIGFTTDTGPRVRAAYENRYVNSRGHTLQADTTISGIRSQINLGYTIPLDDPLTTNLSFNTGFITENIDTYDSDRFKLVVAHNRESSSGWLETYAIDFLRDDFVLNQQEDVTFMTMPGYSLAKTAGDDFINPTKGWRLFGQVRGASDALLSDTSFVQLLLTGKGVISLNQGRFITRFEIGTTWVNDVEELPVSVRYFAGGDQSVRGYDYRTLGPVNSDGDIIGGKHLLTGGLEYDYPFRNNWRAAVFYDGGNAFSSQKLEWKNTVGIGVRWLSPIGPIRFDVAHPFDSDESFRLHITMGPDL